ncbi:hypothetical protein LXL04_030056 [Taraxacum kok-saghyz]
MTHTICRVKNDTYKNKGVIGFGFDIVRLRAVVQMMEGGVARMLPTIWILSIGIRCSIAILCNNSRIYALFRLNVIVDAPYILLSMETMRIFIIVKNTMLHFPPKVVNNLQGSEQPTKGRHLAPPRSKGVKSFSKEAKGVNTCSQRAKGVKTLPPSLKGVNSPSNGVNGFLLEARGVNRKE